ncbi:beta-lactamase/transpeptidase-like protein [Annulohypoxylon moriforme]|nr:beta-lactamase/transpeptidase-like protein [Annulohypoxylon moriforme]
MTQNVDKIYQDVVQSGLLPGISLLAGDKNGNIVYSKSLGKASLKEGDDCLFTEDTICCVEDGTLKLDEDVRSLLPEMGKYGIMTDFVDERNEVIFEPNSILIILRMFLLHVLGYEYDWLNLLFGKWRAARNEQLWLGLIIEDKSALPLVCKLGTCFTYGVGHDWAGKLVQIASGFTLEEFMHDISFYFKMKQGMRDRMATISTLNEKGELLVVDLLIFDVLFGGTDCLVLYEELLNEYIALSLAHTAFLGMRIPELIRKMWSFAGLISKEPQSGWFAKGTTFWAGVLSTI